MRELTEQEKQRVMDELVIVDMEQWYEEWLRELYGDVEICGGCYDAAHIWKNIDPIAYQCGMNNVLDCTYDEFVEIDGEYYHAHEVEELLDEENET